MNIKKNYKMIILDEDVSNIYTGDILFLIQILREKHFILSPSCIKNAYLYAYTQNDNIAIIFNGDMQDDVINTISIEIYDKNVFEKKQMENDIKYMKVKFRNEVLFVDSDYNLLRLSAHQEKFNLKDIKHECSIMERELNYVYARDEFKKIMIEKVVKDNESKYKEDKRRKI